MFGVDTRVVPGGSPPTQAPRHRCPPTHILSSGLCADPGSSADVFDPIPLAQPLPARIGQWERFDTGTGATGYTWQSAEKTGFRYGI